MTLVALQEHIDADAVVAGDIETQLGGDSGERRKSARVERRLQGMHVAEMQRRRVLLACIEVVAARGWAEASVRHICARAGVSRRTFYDSFEEREECFAAAFDDLVDSIAAAVAPALAGGGRWRTRVRAATGVLLEVFERDRAVARVCLVESLKAGPALLERRRRMLAALAGLVDEGRGEARSGAGPAPLTAESVVGGAIAIVHERLVADEHPALLELLNPLMSMIVTPYLGAAAARRELAVAVPPTRPPQQLEPADTLSEPFKDLSIRITFRTARVLGTIAERPSANNREIGTVAGVEDQGQISKLLKRLETHGLIENRGEGHARGEPNAWWLTARGEAIEHALHAPG
ncbi:MAG: TetR family transcriptional regulator [Solirubrobacteraceae bacterium]